MSAETISTVEWADAEHTMLKVTVASGRVFWVPDNTGYERREVARWVADLGGSITEYVP